MLMHKNTSEKQRKRFGDENEFDVISTKEASDLSEPTMSNSKLNSLIDSLFIPPFIDVLLYCFNLLVSRRFKKRNATILVSQSFSIHKNWPK